MKEYTEKDGIQPAWKSLLPLSFIAYLFLYMFPFPFDGIPGIDYLAKLYTNIMDGDFLLKMANFVLLMYYLTMLIPHIGVVLSSIILKFYVLHQYVHV